MTLPIPGSDVEDRFPGGDLADESEGFVGGDDAAEVVHEDREEVVGGLEGGGGGGRAGPAQRVVGPGPERQGRVGVCSGLFQRLDRGDVGAAVAVGDEVRGDGGAQGGLFGVGGESCEGVGRGSVRVEDRCVGCYVGGRGVAELRGGKKR